MVSIRKANLFADLIIALLCFLGGLLLGIIGMFIVYGVMKKKLDKLRQRLKSRSINMTLTPAYASFLQSLSEPDDSYDVVNNPVYETTRESADT